MDSYDPFFDSDTENEASGAVSTAQAIKTTSPLDNPVAVAYDPFQSDSEEECVVSRVFENCIAKTDSFRSTNAETLKARKYRYRSDNTLSESEIQIPRGEWQQIKNIYRSWIGRDGKQRNPTSKRTNSSKISISIAVKLRMLPENFHMDYIGLRHCVVDALSAVDIYTCRLNYYDSDFSTKRQHLFGKLQDSYNPQEGRYSFRFCGTPLCSACFFQCIYGLSRGTVLKLKQDFAKSNFLVHHQNECSGGRPTTTASMLFRAWFIEYAESVGSPDAEAKSLPVPITLPPYGQKLDVIIQYQLEHTAIEEPFLGKEQCYAIWRKEFGHVTIPRWVKHNKCDACVHFYDRLSQTKVKSEIAAIAGT